jgi:hypothetical protein
VCAAPGCASRIPGYETPVPARLTRRS